MRIWSRQEDSAQQRDKKEEGGGQRNRVEGCKREVERAEEQSGAQPSGAIEAEQGEHCTYTNTHANDVDAFFANSKGKKVRTSLIQTNSIFKEFDVISQKCI